MKYKRIISMIAAGAMTLSFMSCSSDNSENKSVAVGTGEEVVVATSVAVTEILDALGVKVSGVPSTSYELPESTDTTTVGFNDLIISKSGLIGFPISTALSVLSGNS